MKHGKHDAANASPLGAEQVFSDEARAAFSSAYPETPHKIPHALPEHPLLALDALAALGESLPDSSIEYNRGNQPIGIDAKPGSNGLTIGETIRSIEQSDSWAVLKNIEQNPAYGALLEGLLAEIKPQIEAKTGRMLKMQGFIFISSPGAVTPYHFDPEHNILMQLKGGKAMTIFPAGQSKYAPDEVHETYHMGGPRELTWSDDLLSGGTEWHIDQGEALFVPVMAPHFVKNGPASSISLSITWRSEWSYAESDARALNALLRRAGFTPKPPKRWPARNNAKSLAWRIYRKIVKAR